VKLGRIANASDQFCKYVRLSNSLEQGKSTLQHIMKDPDPNVQEAVRLTEVGCMQ
jgi:hypothetical protein